MDTKKIEEKLKTGFYYDLNLYKITNKQIYLTCVEFTLKEILKKGYSELYKKLVNELEIVKTFKLQ